MPLSEESRLTPAYFAEGLTHESIPDEMLKARGIRADLPAAWASPQPGRPMAYRPRVNG
jgi:hypothetical protein